MPVSNNKLNVPGLVLIGAYLLWQILMPLRHHLIPGDARITFEGLSFSWRLKAEVYRATPCEIYLEDNGFMTRSAGGVTRFDWQNWPGESEIFCRTNPQEIDWRTLPEIVVLFERDLGERVLYNPLGSAEPPTTVAGAEERILALWRRHFGRTPSAARTILSLESIERSYRNALREKHDLSLPDDKPALAMFLQQHGRMGDGNALSVLRRLPPFSGRSALPKGAPFIVIEDAPLFVKTDGIPERLDRRAWETLQLPIPDPGHPWTHVNGAPLVIYTADFDFKHRHEFPQACVTYQDDDASASPPRISWDYHRSLGTSKGMHISTQPFLLRRYARQLASDWERRHGRRPGVYAKAFVSLNFRSLQPMVDDSVNLAEVPATGFGHNEWIYPLRQPRIKDNERRRAG